jgi:hypothetical protein
MWSPLKKLGTFFRCQIDLLKVGNFVVTPEKVRNFFLFAKQISSKLGTMWSPMVILGLFFTKNLGCRINLTKCVLGFTFGDGGASGHLGVDVMLTIFFDFSQFSAKKLAIF